MNVITIFFSNSRTELDPIMTLDGNSFLEILKHLSLIDLVNFKKTYPFVGDVVDMDFLRKTRGTLSFYDKRTIDEALQILEQFGPFVSDLRFEYKKLDGIEWSEIFSVVQEYCVENLKHFSLCGDAVRLIEKTDVLLIVDILRNVESFKLINWNKECQWSDDLIQILSHCENVRDVTIVSLSGIIDIPATIFQVNKNLVTLQWFGRLTGSGLNAILGSLEHTCIEKLILQSTKLNLNEHESLSQFHRLSCMKILCIDCNQVDLDTFLQSLKSSQALNDLTLCNARLNEDNVTALGEMTQLKALKLDANCVFATSSHLESMLVLCANKNLKSIQLLCYGHTIDRTNYLKIVAKRRISTAAKRLRLILRHEVFAGTIQEIPHELLQANATMLELVDEFQIGLKLQ